MKKKKADNTAGGHIKMDDTDIPNDCAAEKHYTREDRDDPWQFCVPPWQDEGRHEGETVDQGLATNTTCLQDSRCNGWCHSHLKAAAELSPDCHLQFCINAMLCALFIVVPSLAVLVVLEQQNDVCWNWLLWWGSCTHKACNCSISLLMPSSTNGVTKFYIACCTSIHSTATCTHKTGIPYFNYNKEHESLKAYFEYKNAAQDSHCCLLSCL